MQRSKFLLQNHKNDDMIFGEIIILYTLSKIFYPFSPIFIFLSEDVAIIFPSLVDMPFNNLWKLQRVLVIVEF